VSKFKVGDRVQYVRNPMYALGSCPVPDGSCGEIVSGPMPCEAGVWFGDSGFVYQVSFDCGVTSPRIQECLRKIDDRPELATWEAVHASCGWLPGTVPCG
jgi:hypothetical protein